MSNSPPSPQQDEPLESDAVSRGSPSTNEETPIQPDPLPKSDPETVPPAPPISDPDEISHGEDEDDDEEGEEIDEETSTVSTTMDLRIQPPITDPHVSAPDATLASPTGRRGGGKRKKSKGKGRGKPSAKKQQEIESKLQTLRQNLNPIPFIPHKILDFAHHEQLLKKLGLWEFVHIDFDRTIRTDFIAQLVANYNPKQRASNVNGWRVLVNRADLARACRMPSKKLMSNAAAEVDLDREVLSDESIGFLVGLLSDWVLLHEDTWLMPNEVADWMKLIKEGYPEKVDWPGLLWFMVEKEVKQGSQLTDCYYASHLQHLIKHQRKNLFVIEEPAMDEVELVAEANKEVDNGENVENVKDTDPVESTEEVREGDSVVQGPSTELTLGQDGEKEDEGEGVKDDEEGEGVKDDEEGEGVKDLEMIDAEKCKGSSDEEEGGEDQDHDHNHDHDREDQDQEPWLLNGKDNPGELYLQRCSAENAEEFGNFEDRKEEEEEMDRDDDGEEDEDDFHGFPNDDSLEGDGFTGNFIQGLEANQMAFSSEEQLRNAASVDARVDLQHISSTPSFFNNPGKRVIEHDYHHPVNDNSSKRMRINETWDDKPLDFAMCMEQIQQMAQRARMMYEEKEHAAAQWGHTHQLLLHEVEKRDGVIQSLHKARMEETQRKDFAIGRLERELYLMGSVLDGYKKALKETRKAFAEYKERAQLPEEPTYKDAGPGGLMLTAAEIERLRVKREEEFRENCLYLEQRMREVEEAYVGQFDEHLDRVNLLDTRLIGLEADAKELIALHSKRKTPPAEQEEEEVVTQVAKTEPVTEPMEEEAVPEEASQPEPEPEPEPESEPEPEPELEPEPEPELEPEPEPVPEPEEQVPEAAADNQPSPQPDEKVAEVAEVSIS